MPAPIPQDPSVQESALLVCVPAAEPTVGTYRARLDASAREGVPAHLTVLYPFLPPALIDDAVLAALAALFGCVTAFGFTLDRVRWFGDEVVWLGPADEAPFRALTGMAFAAFPSCPPYGGAYADVIPHLTVGDHGGAAELRAAAEAVSRWLPIEAVATEVTLMTGTRPGTRPDADPRARWHPVATFPLRP